MMNKRGFFLAEETMKIILAVICLAFLIFILGKMYYSYSVGKEFQQAKDTMSRIESEVNSMKVGDKGEVVIYGPAPSSISRNYWTLEGFGTGEIPEFCTEKNWKTCLCLCKITLIGRVTDSKCEEETVCAFGNEKISAPRMDLKEIPFTISVNKNKDSIVFQNNP